MRLSDIETYVVSSVCNNYFGGRAEGGCDNCRRKPECDQILAETLSYIEHIAKRVKTVA